MWVLRLDYTSLRHALNPFEFAFGVHTHYTAKPFQLEMIESGMKPLRKVVSLLH
jgi:hypothetical protein